MKALGCAAVLLLAGCAASPKLLAGGVANEQAFRTCPGADQLSSAANVSWQPLASTVAKHRALRERLRLGFPESRERVLYHSFGRHHETVEFSVVATRDVRGTWHVDQAGEQGPGLLSLPATALPRKTHALTTEESRRIDALIGDRCLHFSPTFMRDPNIVSGGATQTLEIERGGRRTVISWFGSRTPQTDQLLKLIVRD